MTRSQINAFFSMKEFGFLPKYFKEEEVGEIQVRRIDLELLERKASYSYDARYYYGSYENMAILPDEGGNEVGHAKQFDSLKFKWYNPLTWLREFREGETIAETFMRLGERAQNVHFVLWATRHGETLWSLTIHKPPKNFGLVSWINEKRRQAKVAISEMLVCSEATHMAD